MATGCEFFALPVLGCALEETVFAFVAPDNRTVRVFLTIGVVNLLHVVGPALENNACGRGVKVNDNFRAGIAGVSQLPPRPHHMS